MNKDNNIQIARTEQTNVALDIAHQLGNKQPPTNSQISELLHKTQQFVEEKRSDSTVPPETLKTLSDFNDVLQATDQLNKNKNKDESLQKIITESAHATKDIGAQGKNIKNDPSMQGRGTQMGSQVKELSQSVFQILKMMVTSGEFRTQINSLIGLLQEMFLIESPSTQSSSSSSTDSSNTSQSSTQTSVPQLSSLPSSEENLIKPSAISNTTTGQAPTAEQQILQIKKEQSVGLIDEDTSSGEGMKNKIKRSWRRNPPSEEKKQEMASHFLTIMRRLNENDQFKQGLNNLIDMFHELRNQVAPHSQMKEAVSSNEHVDTVTAESKKLIEQFSNRPIDPFVSKTKEFFNFIRNDERTRSWFDRFVGLLNDSVRDPHSIDESDFTDRVRSLIDDASQLTKEEEFKNRYSDVGGELRAIAYSIKEDEDVKNLQIQTEKFLSNFSTVDAEGKRHFNGDVVQQMRTFIVPLLVAQLDNIPLPPIQGSNEDMDYFFENMVLSGQDIIPDKIELHTRGDHSIDLKRMSPHHGRSMVFLEIADIKPVMKDIHFKFARKTFPKISDDGVANVQITQNRGITIRIALSLAKLSDNEMFRFRVDSVDVDVSKVDIQIVHAKHDFLLKLFTSIYQTRVKTLLEQQIAEKITQALEKIEVGMNNIVQKYPPSRMKEVISQGASKLGAKASDIKSSLSDTSSEQQHTQQAIQS